MLESVCESVESEADPLNYFNVAIGNTYFPERDGTIPENATLLLYGTGRKITLYWTIL